MHRVLIVEDDDLTLTVLKTFLSSKQFKVKTAFDGTEAMKAVQSEAIDLIISDVQMIPMDGMTFLKKLRDNGNSVPFIVMTGHPKLDNYITAVQQYGAFEYIQKPLDLDVLHLIIKRLLKIE